MAWYLYIAEMRPGKYYVGITMNPERRLRDHNSGKGSRLARGQGPFKLVYVSSEMPDRSMASKREIEVKKWTRQQKEALVKGEVQWERAVVG